MQERVTTKRVKYQLECPDLIYYKDADYSKKGPVKLRVKKCSENKCTYCLFNSDVKADLKEHILLHKCIDTIEKFTTKFNTSNVLSTVKSKQTNTSTSITKLFWKLKAELKSHQCSKCSFWSKKRYLLKDHVIEHKHKLPKFSNLKLKVSNSGFYKCPLCQFSTRDIRKHIMKHQLSMCMPSKKTWTCSNLNCKYKSLTMVTNKQLNIRKPVYVKMEIEDFYKTMDKDILEHSYVQRKCKMLVKCCICNYTTSRKYCLKKHMKIHRETSKINIFQCYFCTSRPQFLKSLSNLTQLVKNTRCFLCSQEIEKGQNLDEHLLLHLNCNESHSEKTFKCLVCKFSTCQLNIFREHVFTHLSNIPIMFYSCHECDYVTNWQYMLSRHKSSHSEKNVDNFLPTTKRRKTNKQTSWNPFDEMDKSDQPFKVIDGGVISDEEAKVSQSTSSSRLRNTEISSEEHLISALLKQSQEDFLLACENKNINVLKCYQCMYYASNESELTDHMFTHLKTEELLKCPYCDFTTDRTDFFKQHKIKHIIKYVCPVCFSEYKTYGTFMSHLRFHDDYNSGEFYNCVYCDQTSVSFHDFKDHVIDHITADVGHKCFKCYDSFSTRKFLINHLAFHSRVQTGNSFVGAVYDSPYEMK